MSWENEFEEYLKGLSDKPLTGLFNINFWFVKQIALSKTPFEAEKLRFGHITVVEVWVNQHGLNIPNLSSIFFDTTKNIENNSKNISRLIGKYKTKLDLEETRSNLTKLIDTKIATNQGKGLQKNDKKKIRKHINKIKDIVEKANLSKSKANAIAKKINSLMEEIDRFGTNLDKVMIGMVEIAIYATQIVKISKPVTAEVKEFMKIYYSNKAKNMSVPLPKPDVQKLIEGTSPLEEE